MELNDNPVLVKSLPFAAAANDDAAGLAFYTEFQAELADIKRCFQKNMTGLHAVHWSMGDDTGFHLYVLDPQAVSASGAMVTIFQQTYHFNAASGTIACVGTAMTWHAAQKQECFATVQASIMHSLYDFDQASVARRLNVPQPDKSPCP